MMEQIDGRVDALRGILKREGLDAWIINGTDPHESEYVCPRWRTRAWISGFTGSAGTVVVTRDKALLWVDSRYFIQGAKEIEGSCFSLMKLDTPAVVDPVTWLAENMKPGSRVGIDAATLTISAGKKMEAAFLAGRIELVGTADFLDELWNDRPPVPASSVLQLDDSLVGYDRAIKFKFLREKCHQVGCKYTLISSLDDIAWVTNLRGDDVAYNPVFLAYLLVGEDRAWLFTSPSRFSGQLLESVSQDMAVLPYEAVFETLASTLKRGDRLYISPERTNTRIAAAIPAGVEIVEGRDFTTDMKAAKNPVELEGMRRAHLLDGVALVNFLARVPRDGGGYDELTIAQELADQRARSKEYLGPSFGPIAGFREHGAMCHYSATDESSLKIEGDGLLVLDTGGMYESGMTDVTRTLLFGTATDEQRRDYTLVLKGNLALASQRFPEGTCGYQLDVLARQFLWQTGMTFYHGTGHGIGFRLNVHEGPQRIGPNPLAVSLVPGMVVSDEPGVYKEGRHGIRIENVVCVVPDAKTEFGQFLSFETLTLCPFERDLIVKEMLTEREVAMVDGYHAWVYEELKDLVDAEALPWLETATRPL